jgi:hypothetical protein
MGRGWRCNGGVRAKKQRSKAGRFDPLVREVAYDGLLSLGCLVAQINPQFRIQLRGNFFNVAATQRGP